MEIPSCQAKDCGFGPHAVHVLPNVFVPMADGVRIAVRFWLPSGRVLDRHFASDESWLVYAGDSAALAEHDASEIGDGYPVILEYLPYRKDDVTAERDHRRHVWLASHGFAVARADLRGCGDSDGFYADEYSPEELTDGRALIGWLAGLPWTNGRVGLFGKSWGGFNGLQLAELGCPGLAAVLSIYSSDDRFNCDIHYTGGCVLGTDALTWSSFMLAINSLPPSPAARPGDWLETWRARLESAGHRPWVGTWLRHQTLDEYWRRGSVRFGMDRIAVPVLLVGGWRDCYTDAALRMIDRLPNSSSCALLGPWSHDWPDKALPGPNIAFLDECLRWWRLHLRPPGARPERPAPPPKFRVFQRTEVAAGAEGRNAKTWRGRWLAAGNCAELLQPGGGVELCLTGGGHLVAANKSDTEAQEAQEGGSWSVEISSRVECGLAYPEFLSFGDPDEAPDQAGSNRHATVWRLDNLPQDLDLLGSAEVALDLRFVEDIGSRPLASPTIGVRLCDHDPSSGRESLVAWGVANLNLSQAGAPPSRFRGGSVSVRLRPATHRFGRGHSLLLAVSAGLWPLAWRCGPASCQLKLVGTGQNRLRLPLLRSDLDAAVASAAGDVSILAGPPRLGPPLPMSTDVEESGGGGYGGSFGSSGSDFQRYLVWDLVSERYVHHVRSHFCPPMELQLPGDHGVRMSWSRHYRHGIGANGDGPTSEAEHRLEARWPAKQVNVAVHAASSLSTDPASGDFESRASLRILLNGREFFCREFHDRIPNATAC